MQYTRKIISFYEIKRVMNLATLVKKSESTPPLPRLKFKSFCTSQIDHKLMLYCCLLGNPLPFDFHTLGKTQFSDDRTFTYATTITVPQGLTEYKASAVHNTKYHAMDFLYGKSYIFEKSIYLKFRGISLQIFFYAATENSNYGNRLYIHK